MKNFAFCGFRIVWQVIYLCLGLIAIGVTESTSSNYNYHHNSPASAQTQGSAPLALYPPLTRPVELPAKKRKLAAAFSTAEEVVKSTCKF